ncbi:MAG TPA: hypothetical protein VGH56_01130, partial [Solirubrobacteraceae bacterium]
MNWALLRLDEDDVLDARLVSRPRLDRLAGWVAKTTSPLWRSDGDWLGWGFPTEFSGEIRRRVQQPARCAGRRRCAKIFR